MIRAALIALILGAAPASAETRYICWRCNAGYSMTGEMTYTDAAAARGIVTQDDITDFRITGFLDGVEIGHWDLAERTPATSWLLRYDPRNHRFILGGGFGLYQAWNANGEVNDCGAGGFGFNSGNAGQDVCIDNRYIAESTIDPLTPFPSYAVLPPDCVGPPLLGKGR